MKGSLTVYFRVCAFDWSEFLREELINLAREYRQMEDGFYKQQYRLVDAYLSLNIRSQETRWACTHTVLVFAGVFFSIPLRAIRKGFVLHFPRPKNGFLLALMKLSFFPIQITF